MYAEQDARKTISANSVTSNLESIDKAIHSLDAELHRLSGIADRIGGSVPVQVTGDEVEKPRSHGLRDEVGRLGADLEKRIERIRHTIARIEDTLG